MINPDNKALNATDTMPENERLNRLIAIKEKKIKQQQIAIGALVLLIVLSSLVGIYAAYLIKPIATANNYDSLVNVLKSKDKYIGIVEADLSKQTDRRVKAENALRDRKPIYVTRVDSIIKSAPDTCKEYLIAVKNECDTLQAKSDSLINELKIEVAKSDTVIEAYKSKGETLEHFNDKLTSENKELGKENKQLSKYNKRAKFWGKVAIGAAVVWTGVVMWVTVVK